jgi:hypothetical protein
MYKKKFLLFLLLPFSLQAQSLDSTRLKQFSCGIGIPYFHTRNLASSQLSYEGIGLLELNIGQQRLKKYESISQFEFSFGLANPSPKIKEKTDWNKPLSILNLQMQYTYLKGLNSHSKQGIHYYAGGAVSSILQYINYPIQNNVVAYNFNWFNLNLSGGFITDLKLGSKNMCLHYLLSIPILSYNDRVSSYIGTVTPKAVWSQDDNNSFLFKDAQFTSIHNNLIINSNLSLNIPIGKNELKIGYNWLLQNNTSRVNRVITVKSSLSVAYCFTKKKKV